MKKIIFVFICAIVLCVNISCVAQEQFYHDEYETYLVVQRDGIPHYRNNRIEYYWFNGNFYYPYFDANTQRTKVIISRREFRHGVIPPPPPPNTVQRGQRQHFSPQPLNKRRENIRPPMKPQPQHRPNQNRRDGHR